ncbi:MAG: nitronate monooxygenase [Steroidobacteraceae bacterium]|nr:nitronate monooxygenase [Steroidobacteraceae bacterium]MDW8260223.1 nitronate monooxygenase [Gammaproteobacteria bacterium]
MAFPRHRDRLGSLRGVLALPLIAAPMFLVSGPALVLAARRAGIIGSFPFPNARTLEVLDEWLAIISNEPSAVPWAANLVVHRSYDRLEPELELLARYRPPIVITALGSPARVVDAVHAYGGLIFADVSTLAFARKAAAAGVDGLVLVCAGAGGHTGTLSPFAFLPAVREFFDGILVLAGCIGDGYALRAAEALGADLAYMGTPFIATHESLACDAYREMVVAATAEDLVPTDAFTGATANYLRASIERAGLDPATLAPKPGMDLSGSQQKIKAWKDIWSAGQGVGGVRAVVPAAELIDRVRREYLNGATS